jgi:hypothetical protein
MAFILARDFGFHFYELQRAGVSCHEQMDHEAWETSPPPTWQGPTSGQGPNARTQQWPKPRTKQPVTARIVPDTESNAPDTARMKHCRSTRNPVTARIEAER